MDFYAVVLRKSASYWVGLCLQNGLVGQGTTQEEAVKQLKEAIDSFRATYKSEGDVDCAPVAIEELHGFLMVEGREPTSEVYELRAVLA